MLDDIDIRMIGISCSMTPAEEAMLRRIVNGVHFDTDYAYADAIKLAYARSELSKWVTGPFNSISIYVSLAGRALVKGRNAMSTDRRIVYRCNSCRTHWYVFDAPSRKHEPCPRCLQPRERADWDKQ